MKDGKEPEPRWNDIKPNDLESTERRLGLYASAVRAGVLLENEGSKLNFLSACERARNRGTKSSAGLLRWLVEKNEFRFVTNDEEEAARRALRAFEEPEGNTHRGEGGKLVLFQGAGRGLSADARFVQQLRLTLQRRGVFEDPFRHLQRARPEWTKERWESADEELRSVMERSSELSVGFG